MKIGICDDEEIYRKKNIELCREFCNDKKILYEIIEFGSGEELLNYKLELDVIILDIELIGIDGIDVKNRLYQEERHTPIIFMTNYQSKVMKGYGRNVYAFIVKDDCRKDLFKALDEINRELNNYCEVEVEEGGIHILITSKQIVRIRAFNQYIQIYTLNNEYIKRDSMNNMTKLLSKYGFYRVNRSNIINFKYIASISNGIKLTNNHKIDVSKKINIRFKLAYERYIRNSRS